MLLKYEINDWLILVAYADAFRICVAFNRQKSQTKTKSNAKRWMLSVELKCKFTMQIWKNATGICVCSFIKEQGEFTLLSP